MNRSKKLFVAFLFSTIIITLFLVFADAKSQAVIGDINGDDKITASDARLALRFSANLENPTEQQKKAADVNNDGKVNAIDARMILRVSAGLDKFDIKEETNDSTTNTPDNNDSQSKKSLTMATNADFYPFEYVEDGIFKGIDIEIAEKIAEKLDMSLKIINMDFDSVILNVQSGMCDIGMSGLTATAEKLENVNFSIPYVTTTNIFEDPIWEDSYSIAISKENTELLNAINKAISELKADGTIDDIVNKYIPINNEDTTDNNQTKKVLVMATNATFAPFEYVENGIYKGIDIEIAKKIAEKLGMSLEIIDMDFDSVILNVQAGMCDIGMSGLTVTAEKLENVNFSIPYVTTYNIFEDSTWEDSFSIAVSKENTELLNAINKVISELKADGTIDSIITKYAK